MTYYTYVVPSFCPLQLFTVKKIFACTLNNLLLFLNFKAEVDDFRQRNVVRTKYTQFLAR